MTATLSLNGLRVTSLKLSTPWTGAWSADVEVDLGDLTDLPTGPATLIINDDTLVGTIDPLQSGRFGPTAKARVVAGAGGWEKVVPAKHYHNDAGVLTSAVFATTAAEVLENVIETEPGRFGVDFTRDETAASRVFSGRTWYVDASGTTNVGPRIPVPATSAVTVLGWDAGQKVATLASEGVILPATVLTDSRFGTTKIRDVEQTWNDDGARTTAWCIPVDATPHPDTLGGGELVATIGAIAGEAVGAKFLATARYRVVTQLGDGRLTIQAVDKDRGLPDMQAISLAPAVPGMSVKVPPGTVLHIVFVDGDRSQPVVVRFEAGVMPLEVDFDGVAVRIGDATATGVATMASMATQNALLVTLCTTLQAFLNFAGVVAISGSTASPCAAAAAALATRAVLPTNFSTRVKASA